MATIIDADGHEFDSGSAYERIKEEALVELSYAATDMADSMSSSARGRITEQAYRDLADAATRLRVIRHGNDRIREQQHTRKIEQEGTPNEPSGSDPTAGPSPTT